MTTRPTVSMRGGGLAVAAVLFLFAAPGNAHAAVCADYPNQAAAQAAQDTRDADGDGIYCEALPCPCATGGGGSSGAGSSSGGSRRPRPTPRPKPKRQVPAPAGARPVRAFYSPTRKSACVLFSRRGGSPFIQCGVNRRVRGYQLARLGRARSVAWQDPVARFPGIRFKTARYGRPLYARGLSWLPVGYARDIQCVVRVATGITCTSPDDHGLRVSVQYQRAF